MDAHYDKMTKSMLSEESESLKLDDDGRFIESKDGKAADCFTVTSDDEASADETTGASPGTAQACEDLGLNSLKTNLERLGIKPPGQS